MKYVLVTPPGQKPLISVTPLPELAIANLDFPVGTFAIPFFIVFVQNDLVALMNSYVKNVKRNGTMYSRLQL